MTFIKGRTAHKLSYQTAHGIYTCAMNGVRNPELCEMFGVGESVVLEIKRNGPGKWRRRYTCKRSPFDRLLPTVTEWRCQTCGALIDAPFCLKCGLERGDVHVQEIVDSQDVASDPTPEEIELMCAWIRASWTKEERARRKVFKQQRRYELPVVATRDLELAAMESPVWQTI